MFRPVRKRFGPAHGDDVPSDDAFLYHATSLERAYDIAVEGLATHGPSWGTDQDVWPDGSTERRSYWNPLANLTWMFSPEGEPVILRAPRDAVAFRRERGTGDFYARKKIPAEHLEIVDAEGRWHPISDLLEGRG